MAQRDPRNLSRWLILALLVIVAGCAHFRKQESSLTLPNPLEIPLEEEEFAWNELVDTVDDYFPIAREERVRLIGNVMTEGRIQTKAVNGPSVFEFFRRDATKGFERWLGTFQSIRRSAEVTVMPSRIGYSVNVVVKKELEDVAQPELSPIGNVIERHDSGLVRPTPVRTGNAKHLGWIPIGRDVELEQKILTDIYTRFNKFAPTPPVEIINDHHFRNRTMVPRTRYHE